MRAYPLFILALASGIFAVAVIGAQDTGPECLTCHTGTAPKGGYRMELPRLVLQAPTTLNGSSSFQLLILVTHDEGYSLIYPKAEVICSASGAEVFRTVVSLKPSDGGHSAVVRVNVTEGPVVVIVSVDMLLYYDHPDPNDPDISPYSVSRSIEVRWGPPIEDLEDGTPVPEEAPFPPLIAIAFVPFFSVYFLRRRRTGDP
jgi:hypothetical protein